MEMKVTKEKWWRGERERERRDRHASYWLIHKAEEMKVHVSLTFESSSSRYGSSDGYFTDYSTDGSTELYDGPGSFFLIKHPVTKEHEFACGIFFVNSMHEGGGSFCRRKWKRDLLGGT